MHDNNDTKPGFRFRGRGPDTVRRILLAMGLAMLMVSCFWLLDPKMHRHFAFSYLVAFMYLVSIALGGLFFVLLHHLTGARWSIVVRRLGEGLMTLLPWLVILFIPVVFMLHSVFEWSHADAVAHDNLLQHKAAYLNPTFFVVRSLGYFAIWGVLATVLFRKSLRQDQTGDPEIQESMRRWSAPGMILFALTTTFAAFDWLMSVEPHWFSTIFGVYYFAGIMVSVLSFMILLAIGLGSRAAMGNAITPEHFHDLGKLLFAFIIFWAYIAFSQMMLIWMANLPEETFWYRNRWEPAGWRMVSVLLLVGHFILPFFYLLLRFVKRTWFTLGAVATWMLVMHYVDLYWIVMPTFSPNAVPLHVMDIFLMLGLTALFLSVYLWKIGRHPLVPAGDPHLKESLAFENM